MTMTTTRITLSAAILLGITSGAFAMSPTGQNYRPFAGAYASTGVATASAASKATVVTPTQAELADRNSFYYRR
jgi:hypothetical protein